MVGFTAGIAKMPLNLPQLHACSGVGVFWGMWAMRIRNNKPLSYLLTDFAAMLTERGVAAADLDVIFRDNPRRLLLGEPAINPAV